MGKCFLGAYHKSPTWWQNYLRKIGQDVGAHVSIAEFQTHVHRTLDQVWHMHVEDLHLVYDDECTLYAFILAHSD